jgi:hypothetical protein
LGGVAATAGTQGGREAAAAAVARLGDSSGAGRQQGREPEAAATAEGE